MGIRQKITAAVTFFPVQVQAYNWIILVTYCGPSLHTMFALN